jgi:hypothetical protein
LTAGAHVLSAASVKRHPLTGIVIAALLLQSASAAAQQPAPAPPSEGTSASASSRADTDDEGSSPAAPIGWVLAIGGGAATAIGAGILVVGAFAEADDAEASALSQQELDPGIGRGDETATTGGAATDAESLAGYDVAAAVMGAGALALGVGIYLIFTGDRPPLPKDEPAATARAPRVWRSGRTTGMAFQF